MGRYFIAMYCGAILYGLFDVVVDRVKKKRAKRNEVLKDEEV